MYPSTGDNQAADGVIVHQMCKIAKKTGLFTLFIRKNSRVGKRFWIAHPVLRKICCERWRIDRVMIPGLWCVSISEEE
jgi:hypothetical protein